MDWIKFFQAYRIYYVTTGPRTTKGWVEIKCPFCGSADPSQHMGVKLRGRRWHCWRNAQHTGSDPAELIQQLLGCSRAEARALARDGDVTVGLQDHEITSQLRAHLGEDAPRRSAEFLLRAEQVRPLTDSGVLVEPFLNYLRGRGYTGAMLEWLIDAYDLHYATRGPYRSRIVFPIKDRHRNVLTCVGRSIRRHDELRYLAHPMTQRGNFAQAALVDTKRMLLGLPLLWRAENPQVLVICEGPFDATRITVLGWSLGVYATCLFGLDMSAEQLAQVIALRQRFPKVVLLLDPTTGFQPFRLANSGLDCITGRTPPGVEDPGAMSARETLALCTRLLSLTPSRNAPMSYVR